MKQFIIFCLLCILSITSFSNFRDVQTYLDAIAKLGPENSKPVTLDALKRRGISHAWLIEKYNRINQKNYLEILGEIDEKTKSDVLLMCFFGHGGFGSGYDGVYRQITKRYRAEQSEQIERVRKDTEIIIAMSRSKKANEELAIPIIDLKISEIKLRLLTDVASILSEEQELHSTTNKRIINSKNLYGVDRLGDDSLFSSYQTLRYEASSLIYSIDYFSEQTLKLSELCQHSLFMLNEPNVREKVQKAYDEAKRDLNNYVRLRDRR